jgi:hypothetical protein
MEISTPCASCMPRFLPTTRGRRQSGDIVMLEMGKGAIDVIGEK